MKRFFRPLIPATLLAVVLAANVQAKSPPTGVVNFGRFTPPAAHGEFVEVNINSNLIAMAIRLGKDSEPELADLLRGLEGIHVNVIGLDDTNRSDVLARVQTIRADLDARGWSRVVTVQQKDQDIGVYIRTRGDESVMGVAVTVISENKQAVLINVVGDIKLEKLAAIGERFNIEPLKKIGFVATKKS